MNYFMAWCKPTPTPSRDDLIRWEFSHGSVVWAEDMFSAVEKLVTVKTNNFWAFEIEPGIWDVQFEKEDDPYVMVTHVRAATGVDAAKSARWYLHLDHQTEEIVKTSCSSNFVSKYAGGFT
jgi:hypothetical protein